MRTRGAGSGEFLWLLSCRRKGIDCYTRVNSTFWSQCPGIITIDASERLCMGVLQGLQWSLLHGRQRAAALPAEIGGWTDLDAVRNSAEDALRLGVSCLMETLLMCCCHPQGAEADATVDIARRPIEMSFHVGVLLRSLSCMINFLQDCCFSETDCLVNRAPGSRQIIQHFKCISCVHADTQSG